VIAKRNMARLLGGRGSGETLIKPVDVE